MLHIFIMRHGEAEAVAETDLLRELTPSGQQDILQMVADNADDLALVDTLWVSPYMRAQQTAQLVATQLPKPIQTQTFLTPAGNPKDVISALAEHSDQTILIVSHQPLIGTVVDNLAGLEPGRYRMGTGALAYIQTDIYASACGELQWLRQPESVCPSDE